MRSGLLRSTLTLLAGGVLAQALPLLLGPWLTRIYSPSEFGQFATLWALAANLAVVGCARYEFALPLETQDGPAAVLMALCARLLLVMTVLAAVIGAVMAYAQGLSVAWLLPLAVLASALTQWLTLWASRAGRFNALAVSRVLQYGGAAVLQLGMGLLTLGVWGLLLGPVLAGLAAAALLAKPAPLGGWAALWLQPWAALKAMAQRHREFPLLNTPHAFAGALQDSVALVLLAWVLGDASAGFWALALRYLKAPASLVGSALSQPLYTRLVALQSAEQARQLVQRLLALLLGLALGLALVLLIWGPALFVFLFGERWLEAGQLARALAPYIALHFVASPLSVATLAWGQQAWALRLALWGQVAFALGLGLGLFWGGLIGAAWGVSAMMSAYFAYFFLALPARAAVAVPAPVVQA
ncbi:lipopolysaccharide biosynthesis protein [Paucibacter sp. Y2R2-4]|uniref:lipopolysaccharide biosynthesis protein n=1 Tax=Paucibacter sp. Y2R2-4 TaxID=2893553 RepID=UPI0021E3818B|nr:oligosaccharide flippase family protein [Paucibacter sp. Y2R2-4]MCV2349749.1 oligosaccharide flippase family protein [Paucibacter sp. Y2R2-4]